MKQFSHMGETRIAGLAWMACLALALSASVAPSSALRTAPAAPQANPTVITLTNGARIQYAGLATADFNGDGYKEIVAGGSDGYLHVVSTSNGTTWSEVWSRQTNTDIEAANPPTHKATIELASTPAIADLDNDGHLDVVVAVGGDIHVPKDQRENGGVLVYRYHSAWNFSLIRSLAPNGMSGWPQPRIDRVGDDAGYGSPDGYWDGIVTAPALCDLDGNGDLEIVVAGIDRRLWAWHHTGELVAGWPIYRYDEFGNDNNDNLLRGGLSSPACGDIDGDGLPEVVVGTMSPYWDRVSPPDYNTATVWAINGDSTNVPGWPKRTEQLIHSSPALGDLDNDGELEVVVGVGWGTTGRTNIVYIWNGDGTALAGWPKQAGASTDVLAAPPALGDVDNDGYLEVVMGCGNTYDLNSCGAGTAELYAWNVDGTNVAGFPMAPDSPNLTGSYTMPYTPILADLDGDGRVEILIVHLGAWGITVVDSVTGAVDSTGRLFPGGLFAPPLVDDVDGDGLLEVLAGGGDSGSVAATIRIWNESGSANVAQPWPMFRHDVKRTGKFPYPPRLGFPSAIRMMLQQSSGLTASFTAPLRNLGEGQINWSVSESIQGFTVTVPSGTVVTMAGVPFTASTVGRPAGWTSLGNVTVAGIYNGHDVLGSPKTVPVWLYIGDLKRMYLPLSLRNVH